VVVFISVILQKRKGVTRARDIKLRLEKRLEQWEKGSYRDLVNDVVSHANGGSTSRSTPTEESFARAYNAKILSGRIRQAVRAATNREGGGVLGPADLCTKTGRPVVDVLRSMHSPLHEPSDVGSATFEKYSEIPDPPYIDVTQDMIQKVATRLSGAAGPSGIDAVDLQNWLLRYGKESKALCEELAVWGSWLANESPPWAAYRAMMACQLVALDKQPGVRPVGIGEIFRRLLAKAVLLSVGSEATLRQSKFVRRPQGRHRRRRPRSAWSEDLQGPDPSSLEPEDLGANPEDTEGPPTLPDLLTQPMEPDEGVNEEDDPYVVLLVDVTNGFNELSRKAALWTVRHRWASGARFTFNCYRHSATLILRRPGHPNCYVLQSREGVTQGDPLAMVIYGLAMPPLSHDLRERYPKVLQPWYADDTAMEGPASAVAEAFKHLAQAGPARGYFPAPEKSILIARPEDQAAAATHLERFEFDYRDGARYLGSFLGATSTRDEWLDEKLATWIAAVRTLAKLAKRYPQTAYTGMSRSLQMEWQYTLWVIPDSRPNLSPSIG
jgi:hypothetical protein